MSFKIPFHFHISFEYPIMVTLLFFVMLTNMTDQFWQLNDEFSFVPGQICKKGKYKSVVTINPAVFLLLFGYPAFSYGYLKYSPFCGSIVA